MTKLRELTKKELLAHLEAHVGKGRTWVVGMVAYLAEVEERRVHLDLACSSMFDFCTRRLKMSEAEAAVRLIAARLARRFPSVLGYLERGDVHLCALRALRDYLTDDNHEELLREASGKSTREVKELLARRFPRPDVMGNIEAADLGPSYVPPGSVEPLSASRYRMELTISAELKERIDRITDRMRHRNPTGDLEVIMDAAMRLLEGELEKERLGKREHRHEADADSESAVREKVFERDGERCTYVAEDGQRCPARGFLELDHVDPKARGGEDDEPNLRVRCRAHNRLYAEQTFGRAFVEEKVHSRQRKLRAIAPMMMDRAVRGLKHMGFANREVERALAMVETTLDPAAASVERIVREALAILT